MGVMALREVQAGARRPKGLIMLLQGLGHYYNVVVIDEFQRSQG